MRTIRVQNIRPKLNVICKPPQPQPAVTDDTGNDQQISIVSRPSPSLVALFFYLTAYDAC